MRIKSPEWKPSPLRSCCQEYNPKCTMCNSMGQVSIKILQGDDYSATYINGKIASQEDHIYHLLKEILPVLNTLNLSNIELTCTPASAFEFDKIWDNDAGYLPNWSDIEKYRL